MGAQHTASSRESHSSTRSDVIVRGSSGHRRAHQGDDRQYDGSHRHHRHHHGDDSVHSSWSVSAGSSGSISRAEQAHDNVC